MDIVKFLLARIAEDEAAARELDPNVDRSALWSGPEVDTEHGFVGIAPTRVFAECEAKRRIVAQYQLYDAYAQQHRRPEDERERMNRYAMTVWDALRALALPYADHPDYREEWKVGLTPSAVSVMVGE